MPRAKKPPLHHQTVSKWGFASSREPGRAFQLLTEHLPKKKTKQETAKAASVMTWARCYSGRWISMLLGRAVVEEAKQSTGEKNFLLRCSWDRQGQRNLHRKLATWVIIYPCEYGLGYITHMIMGKDVALDFSMRILKDLGLCLQGAHRLSFPPTILPGMPRCQSVLC